MKTQGTRQDAASWMPQFLCRSVWHVEANKCQHSDRYKIRQTCHKHTIYLMTYTPSS